MKTYFLFLLIYLWKLKFSRFEAGALFEQMFGRLSEYLFEIDKLDEIVALKNTW